jgi:hypothetical protein
MSEQSFNSIGEETICHEVGNGHPISAPIWVACGRRQTAVCVHRARRGLGQADRGGPESPSPYRAIGAGGCHQSVESVRREDSVGDGGAVRKRWKRWKRWKAPGKSRIVPTGVRLSVALDE